MNLWNALLLLFYYTCILFLKIFYSLWTIFNALNTSANYLFSLSTRSYLKHPINSSWLFSSLLNPSVKAFTHILLFYTVSCHLYSYSFSWFSISCKDYNSFLIKVWYSLFFSIIETNSSFECEIGRIDCDWVKYFFFTVFNPARLFIIIIIWIPKIL